METIKLRETDEFIKLGQALKKAGRESSGGDAKMDIQSARGKVNGEIEERRGRKLYDGDIFEFDGKQVKVEK